MKRPIKITALIAAAVAAGSIATGLAAASTTTTVTHPITLCVSKVGGGTVATPGLNGQCSRAQSAINVASASDVAALAARLDTAEQTISDQAAAISSLQSENSSLGGRVAAAENIVAALPRLTLIHDGGTTFTLDGANLRSGSMVTLHYRLVDGTPVQALYSYAAANGTVSQPFLINCDYARDAYVVGFDAAANPVTSNLLPLGPPPGCGP
jgi:hypothetical protein